MAVKRAEAHEQQHWEHAVAPRLGSDVTVLDDLAHDAVLGVVAAARAMVFPIQWDEPFGLVMAEALACGTPVITRPLGAAPEIVRHGETGFLCDGVDEMVRAVREAAQISPAACRARVAQRYSAEAMIDGYEDVYRRTVN